MGKPLQQISLLVHANNTSVPCYLTHPVADGVHSRLRKLIVGEGHVARKTGLTCYRTIVSLQDAKEVLGEAGLSRWMKQSASSLISGADGTACIITVYPIRVGEYFNMSCILKTDSSKAPIENS